MACCTASRPTLLIPYGVRSFLECVFRAYRIEDPQDIKQFLAAYCKDLLENRDRSPSKDLKQAILLYQKKRERDQVSKKSWSLQGSPDVPPVSLPSGEPAEVYQDPPCAAGSVSLVSCQLTRDAMDVIQSVQSQPESLTSTGDIPAARVQSAVFQRVPSRSDLTEIQGTVMIDSASAPPASVIVVHSENLPNAIVFHSDSCRPSSALSGRSSASKTLSLTDADGTEDCGVEAGLDGMVVFERVPSKEEFPPAQSSVEVECGELQNLELIDRPLTSAQEDQCSEGMEMKPNMQTLAAQEPSIVNQASPKRSLLRVFSAHMVKSENSFTKSSWTEQSDRNMSPRTSSMISITECPGSCGAAINNIGESSDIDYAITHATDSPAEASPQLVMSVDLSEESELEGTPAMAATVNVAASTESCTTIATKLSEKCSHTSVGVLTDNRESSESLSVPGEITESDTHRGMYSETVTVSGVTAEDGVTRPDMQIPPGDMSQDASSDFSPLAEIPQTTMSVLESVSPVCTEEREEQTVAQGQSSEGAVTVPTVEIPVHVTSSFEKYIAIGKQLAEECLAEAVRMLTNERSSESTPVPGEITETDTLLGMYSATVTLSGVTAEGGVTRLDLPTPPANNVMSQDASSDCPPLAEPPQTVMSVFESVSPVHIEETEGTVAQGLSDAATAAGTSDSPAELSGTDTDQSTETYINTIECSPREALQESVASVSPVRSPVLMDTGGILADGTEMSPTRQVHPEIYGLADDLTSPSDGTCTCPVDTKVITAASIHYVDENLTDTEKTADVGRTEVSAKTSVSSDLRSSSIMELMTLSECAGSVGAEGPETAENDLKVDVQIVLSEHSGVSIEAESLLEPVQASVDCVNPAESSTQENMRETADEDDLNRTAEFLADNSELSRLKEEQAEETSNVPEEQERTVLTSTAYEGTANTAHAHFSVEKREAETAAQEPSAEDVLCAAAPAVQSAVPSKSSGNDSAECPETAENVLQVDVVSVSARYSGSEITERLASEPVEDYGHSMTLVSSSSEEHMREDTETGPAAHTPEPAVSHTHSPCAFPESDGPKTCEIESDLSRHTGLNREEEVVVQQPARHEALSESPVIYEGPNSSAKGHLLNSGLFESLETETFQKLEIAETDVPQDAKLVSAEDRIEHRLISPDGSSQETVNGNNKMDDLSLVMGVPKAASDVLKEECSIRQVLSEENNSSKLSDNTSAQVVTASEGNTNILETTISSNIPSLCITEPWEETRRLGGTTDKGTSPVISPKTSSMLGCVHASTQVSGLSVEMMATGSQGEQSSLSDSGPTQPPSSSNETTSPPTNSVQTENVQDEENTENALTGRGTPCTDPVLKSSVSQMWTLYHLPHNGDEGTLCTNVLAQPPFNGSAYIRSFGPGHVLLAERSPPPSSHNLHQATEGPRKCPNQASDLHHLQQRPQDVASTATDMTSRSPSDSETLEISLPNYLLCLDDSGKQVTPLLGAPSVPAQAVRLRQDNASGVLSLSLPMDMVSDSQRSHSHAQFLQITTDRGQSVYSPAVLRIATRPADQNQK